PVAAGARPAGVVGPPPAPPAPWPRLSLAAPSEAVSLAAWVAVAQPPAGRTNTYAAPCPLLAPIVAPGAPAAIVEPSPDTPTPLARLSFAAPAAAGSLAA